MPETNTPPKPQAVYDAIVVGAGPAGLAAAVYLGRYLRPTLVLNHKKPQTRWHRPIAHNVLGFPAGIHRNQLLDWGRTHVALYECVRIERATVHEIRQTGELFELTDEENVTHRSKGLILAPGVEYELPDIPNVLDYAGITIWHCPECDGYKCVGKKIAVIGYDRGSAEMALNVSIWADQVTLLFNGHAPELDAECEEKLKARNIAILSPKITRILGEPADELMHGFELEGGGSIEVVGAFVNYGAIHPEALLKQLPLELYKDRWVQVDYRMRTNIPRCYAAGDIVAHAQTQLSVAMGTGATAGIWLHKELLPPELCLSGRDWS